jgi:hypothetical protein
MQIYLNSQGWKQEMNVLSAISVFMTVINVFINWLPVYVPAGSVGLALAVWRQSANHAGAGSPGCRLADHHAGF